MKAILVTGGAGYIGSHVCKSLHEKGYTPIVYDNLSRGFKKSVLWGPLIEGDVRDVENLEKVFNQYEIKAVIHLAAFAYIAESIEKPKMYFENNVDGIALLLEAMARCSVKNLVFSSSCAVYGESQQALINESHPTHPINPYGLSKLMGEKIFDQYSEAGFRHCSLRYFNAGGADSEREIGENHDPEPHLIPSLLKRAASGKSLQINGDDYPTSDGTCVRDFIHVTDLANAHTLVVDRLLQEALPQKVYNLGTGKGFSLKEVAETVIKQTSKNSRLSIGARREGDPASLVCDSQSFKEEFSWKPEHSSIENIVATAWEWEKKKSSLIEH